LLVSVLCLKPCSGIILIEKAPSTEKEVGTEKDKVEIKEYEKSALTRVLLHLGCLHNFHVL
jgi:hypothetical protein